MSGRSFIVVAVAVALAGCSSGSGLSTGSLFGSGEAATPVAAPAGAAGPVNDPTSRAFQVGSVSARAVKCGYNFDPAKLKANFLATESTAITPADLPRVEKVYDTAYNGVTKAVAAQPGYCTPGKTADIKANLTRHLAGDFSPAPVKQVAKPADDGWFSNWGGSGDGGPKFGSDDWWAKQTDAIGG